MFETGEQDGSLCIVMDDEAARPRLNEFVQHTGPGCVDMEMALSKHMLLAVAALVGCKSSLPGEAVDEDRLTQKLVEALCGPFVQCDCENASALEDNSDCAEATRPFLEAAVHNAADLGLRFHSSCLTAFVDYEVALGCDAPDELDEEEIERAYARVQRCKMLTGRGARGDTCVTVGGLGVVIGDTCGEGLACDGAVCRPLPASEGDWCGGLATCPAGLVCIDPQATGALTCQLPGQKGMTCNPHDVGGCGVDLICDADELECEELPEDGDLCLGGLCSSGLSCMEDICTELPGKGDACLGFLCDPQEAVCNPDTSVCDDLPDEGETCPTGVCDQGLTCDVDGTCRESAAAVCQIVESVGLCIYANDGICDEPSGTGLCADGTDGADCGGATSGGTSDWTESGWTGVSASFTTDPSWTTGDSWGDSTTSTGGWWESSSSTGWGTSTSTSTGY